jgi:ribosomal protein S18 acetylase RimI-like enzyme
MAFLEEAARGAGIRTLHLEVVESNTTALQLYRKLGFAEHRSTFLSKWIAQDFSKPRGLTGH